MRRSQTATEYLVILAVVIVIALVVVGILGGIPSIGGGVNKQANDVALQSLRVGVENYVVDGDFTRLLIRNSLDNNIQIQNITIGNETCIIPGGSVTISKFGKKAVNCIGLTQEELNSKFDKSFSLSYKDLSTDSIYIQNDLSLVGTVGNVSTTYVLDASDNSEDIIEYTGSGCGASSFDGDFGTPGVASVCRFNHTYQIPKSTVSALLEHMAGGNGGVSIYCYNKLNEEISISPVPAARVNLSVPSECLEKSYLKLYINAVGSPILLVEEQVWFEVIDN